MTSGPTLRIIAINDVYSLDNLPRLRTLVEHHRTTAPADVLLVTLAGDFVAPSVLSSLDAGRGMVACMRAVGVTHATFGNHEDDIATVELRARIEELGATWISTNVVFEPALPRSAVVTIGRVRVGLIGVVMTDETTYRRRPFGGGPMIPANAAARAEASRLVREERCNVVLPLTHQPLADDRALAHLQRDPPFPVIIGGHDHAVVLESVEGTWLAKAGSDAAHATIIDLVWPLEAAPGADGVRDVPEVRVRIDDVAGYVEDGALRDLVERHTSQVRELETATLMMLAPGTKLSSVGSRARQTSMGTLICTAIRETLEAEGCIFNGGGIRGTREYHAHLTYGDLKAEVAFDNEIVTVGLPGAVLRDAIRASRAKAPLESGSFLSVDDGIEVDEHGVVIAAAGAPLDPSRIYRIALVRELLFGLDHIEPLVRWAGENAAAVPAPGCGRESKQILIEAFSFALWRAMGGFDAVDANHDGVVTEAEVFTAEARVTGEPGSHVTAGLVVRAIDADHDGTISRDEARAVPERHEVPLK